MSKWIVRTAKEQSCLHLLLHNNVQSIKSTPIRFLSTWEIHRQQQVEAILITMMNSYLTNIWIYLSLHHRHKMLKVLMGKERKRRNVGRTRRRKRRHQEKLKVLKLQGPLRKLMETMRFQVEHAVTTMIRTWAMILNLRRISSSSRSDSKIRLTRLQDHRETGLYIS